MFLIEFLILVDIEDFDNSWKLKRNLELLKPSIKNYIDSFSNKKLGVVIKNKR
jgi:hypothetical protein